MRWSAGLGWLLLTLAVADWIALRRGVAPNPPQVLAILVLATVLAFLVRLSLLSYRLVRNRKHAFRTASEVVLLCGLVMALAGGSANYLLGLRGAVILYEGETMHLHGGSELQAFTAGPLARLEEMGLVLSLAEVDLVATGNGSFFPRSKLLLQRDRETVTFEVDPQNGSVDRTLRFFQGAFGFAPRIEILRNETTIFDHVVPFITKLHGPDGISFEGSFSVATEDLQIEGSIDLASLDEAMRGHATLFVTLRKQGMLLGRGSLLPGHFATLPDGYRVGFTDLKRWSEIDISRRSYGQIVLAGATVMVTGAVLWCVARWRER